jgi:uncharacterized protein
VFAVVDTGPLYAAVDADDEDHKACRRVLENPRFRLVIPTLVVAEATYLVATRLGAKIEAAFLRGLAELDVQAPEPDDWVRIAEIVARYREHSLGAANASVVALAERLKTDVVVTLDRRHFRAIRTQRKRPLKLLP